MRETAIASTQGFMKLGVLDAVEAELRIAAVDSKQVDTPPGKVLLTDLSPDSLRFRTTLRMPPDHEWDVILKFMLEGVSLEVQGRITFAAADRQWWTYEAALSPDPVLQTILTRILNQRLKRLSPLLYRAHVGYGKQSGMFPFAAL